ncbi:hypothetical protein D3C71_1822070 [compost metagenome]
MAHMPATEQGHRVQAWRQAACHGRGIRRHQTLKRQMHHPTTTLPQSGAQRKPQGGSIHRVCAAQALARLANGLMLQMPPSDGAHHVVGKHGHPRPGFARHGALGRLHHHQAGRCGLQATQQQTQIRHTTLSQYPLPVAETSTAHQAP